MLFSIVVAVGSWVFAFWSWRFAMAAYPPYVLTLSDALAYKERDFERERAREFVRLTIEKSCSRCVHVRVHGATSRCHRIAFPIEPAFPEVAAADSCSQFDPGFTMTEGEALLYPLLAAADRRFEERIRRPGWQRRILAVLRSPHAR